MTTHTVRRLYTYLAACIGLYMLSGGASVLCTLLGERWLGGAPIGAAEMTALRMGGAAALIAVGAPLWGGHWLLARRDARQPDGQRSALRRLYAYAVLLVATIVALLGLQEGLSLALEGQGPQALLSPLVDASVAGVVWLAHWRIFCADRDLVEGSGPNATLRRWYLALALWASLAMLSFGAGVLIHAMLQHFVFAAAGTARQLALPAAALISGLALWLPHELWSRRLIRRPGPLQADELGATLRQVFAALVIVSSLVAALTGLTALLAAGLQAGLGVAGWAGAFARETRGLAALAVGLPILLYYREQLAVTARLSGAAERVDTARRVISYLINAVSLAALYFGLGGLLGTLLRLWLGSFSLGGAWRTPLSWYTALTLVALPVYGLASWRSEGLARASADEERVLSRRIYLYAALLFGLIAGVVTATQLVQLLVVTLLGQGERGAAGEIGRLVGYTALGISIVASYGLMLARAGAARGSAGSGRTIALVADEPLRQALRAAMSHELPGAAIIDLGPADSPERRAALAAADVLVIPLAVLSDPTLASFRGPRLLLATPLEGVTLVGARRAGPALAREAARAAGGLCGATPPSPRPAAPKALAAGVA